MAELGVAVDFGSIGEGVAEGCAWIERTERDEMSWEGMEYTESGRLRMFGAVILDKAFIHRIKNGFVPLERFQLLAASLSLS